MTQNPEKEAKKDHGKTGENHPFKTPPYAHQLAAFERSKDREAFALLMEQRTGKTKVVIDTACYLYGKGEIDAVLVVAPNGVHREWHRNQWPDHAWDHVDVVSAAWSSSPNKADRDDLAHLWALHPDGPVLRVLHVNVEALSRPNSKARKEVKLFLETFRCLTAIDESTTIKTPSAKRTKAVWKLGEWSAYRRILTGTPATRSPLDLYGQFRFLGDEVLGFRSYYAFRNRYAVLKRRQLPGRPAFDEVVGYQNLEELVAKVAEHSYRITKDECFDLPPRTTTRRPVELSPRQRELYDRVRKEALLNLTGEDVAVPHVLTQLTRCQQVLGGYVPPDADEPAVPVQKEPVPRLVALLDELEQLDGKALIWARFTPEIDAICAAVAKAHGPRSVRRYDGRVKAGDRMENVAAFQEDPEVRFLVLQPQAGSRGLELYAAGHVFWYSASFSLEDYLQANERPHSAKQTKNVAHVHLCAEGTVDERIIGTLEANKELADLVTGDDPKRLFE